LCGRGRGGGRKKPKKDKKLKKKKHVKKRNMESGKTLLNEIPVTVRW